MKLVPLTSICKPKQWKTISTKELKDYGYPVYGANGQIGFYDKYTHEFPTVLITCRGATCGSIHISEPKSYVNGNAMALDNLSEDVSINYLAHYLRFRRLDDVISGSAQPQITGQGLSNLLIPLPPLEQQKKIAVILDAADAYWQKTKALIAKYDELTQSLFLDMFGDPVTNPKSFPTKSLGELCLFFSGRAWKNIELGDKGYRIVRISNLHKPDFPYWLYDGVMIDRHKVEEGDLLFSWAGVATSIDAYLYQGETALLNQHIYNIKPKEGLNKKYIFKLLQLNLENLRSSLGGGVGQFHLKKNDITSIQVLMPDPDLMKVYLNCVETLDNQKAQAQASLEKAEELFNSLLQRAFKGELV